MSAATTATSSFDRTSMMLGTAMMLAWTFWMGIGGLVLLLAVAYAFVNHSPTLGIVCSFLVFAPLMMTIVWGVAGVCETVRHKWITNCSLPGPTWWERRKSHRVLYQAYYF
jgi:hypothetical protein